MGVVSIISVHSQNNVFTITLLNFICGGWNSEL